MNPTLPDQPWIAAMTREQAHEFTFTTLGFCVCGEPQLAIHLVYLVLQVIEYATPLSGYSADIRPVYFTYDQREKWLTRLLPTTALSYFFLYQLDRAGLTEHGSGIGGCWLTDTGRAYLHAIREYGIDGIEDLDN